MACYGVKDATDPWLCYPCQKGELRPVCAVCQTVGTVLFLSCKDVHSVFTPVQGSYWAHTICLMFASECGFLLDPAYESVTGFPDFTSIARRTRLWGAKKQRDSHESTSGLLLQPQGSLECRQFERVVSHYFSSPVCVYSRIPGNDGFINGKGVAHALPCVVCHGLTSGIPLRCQ